MPAAAPSAPFSAEALATALIAGESQLPVDLDDTRRTALAWALKDAALACWSTNQAQVATVEELLRQLLALDRSTPASPIPALHDWVAALAAIAAGRMSDADTLLQQAASQFRALGLAAAAAQTQVPRVLVLCMQGRLDDAEQCGIAARDELVALGDMHAASRVSLNLGQLSCERSDFRAAVAHFESATAGFREAEDRERAVQSSIGLADALAATGEFDAALQRYAAAHDDANAGGWMVLAALCNELSALVQLAQGDYATALAGFEKARQQYERLQMPQHLANIERQLGETYLELHLLPEASALLQATIERFEGLEMRLEAAWTRIEFAKTLASKRSNDPRIEAELSAAEQLFAAEKQRAGQATAVLARAEHAMHLGDTARARELATSAAEEFRQLHMSTSTARAKALAAVSEWHNDQSGNSRETFAALLSLARESGLLSIELCALTHLGYVASHERDRDSARHYFERAIAIVEEQRHRLSGDDLRHAFLNGALAPYRELLRLALDDSSEPDRPIAVLLALERFRSRALADRLGDIAVGQATGNTTLDDLQHRLAWSQRRLRRLREDGEDTETAETEIRQLENEYLEVQRRWRLTDTGNRQSGFAVSLDERSLAALQERLPISAAVIEYGVIDDELFACVINGASVRMVRSVATWNAVEGAIRRVQFQIDAMRASRLLPPQHVLQLEARARKALQQLHDLIWAPLIPSLNQARHLLVVPHEKLGTVAFAALNDGSRYLGEQVEIAVTPSIAVAAQVLARRAPAIVAPLVLADTQCLVHASREADALRQIFPFARVEANDRASGDSLRQFGSSADSIHLACHGVFRSDNPAFSAMELADGNFSALDAEKLGLSNALVVLSACDSGVATEAEGDEVFGLVRAFLIGGASRVVASLWPVDDETTVDWMTAFYRALQSGATPAGASQLAQRAVRERHPHPFHWAPFATFGGW
jgi:CHAT domain-containing protein